LALEREDGFLAELPDLRADPFLAAGFFPAAAFLEDGFLAELPDLRADPFLAAGFFPAVAFFLDEAALPPVCLRPVDLRDEELDGFLPEEDFLAESALPPVCLRPVDLRDEELDGFLPEEEAFLDEDALPPVCLRFVDLRDEELDDFFLLEDISLSFFLLEDFFLSFLEEDLSSLSLFSFFSFFGAPPDWESVASSDARGSPFSRFSGLEDRFLSLPFLEVDEEEERSDMVSWMIR
jgi:hypothetical protein